MTEYIKGEGNIFTNDYKKMKSHPDMKGKIKIPKALVKAMAEKFKESNIPEIEMDLAMWDRVAKNTGKQYKFARLEMPYVKVEQQQAQQVAETVAVSEASDEDVPF